MPKPAPAPPPSIFSRSDNPIPTRGAQIIPTYYYWPHQILSPSNITAVDIFVVRLFLILMSGQSGSIGVHSGAKCLAWIKKCHHIWLDQNFDPSLLTNKLWLVFVGMKQKKRFFLKFKMADSKELPIHNIFS